MTRRSEILCDRDRFLRAVACRRVDRPPIWFMRQAGRCLPEYRALKEKHSFLELAQTPELAAEVTLQPIRRFQFDAAIIFSDILVIPEALGQPYRFDQKGIRMDFTIQSRSDVARLNSSGVEKRLAYVGEALRIVRRELGDRTALIGFGGSPWTLANYMLSGAGRGEPDEARRLIYTDHQLFDRLMSLVSEALVRYIKMQIRSGADVIQIFDSWGGALPAGLFDYASGRWMRRIIRALGSRVPVIVFSRGAHDSWDSLAGTGASVLGIDWGVRLATAAAAIPRTIALQGNLDPALLVAEPAEAKRHAKRILEEMRGRKGFIFNLGHGVPPEARLETMASVIETVKKFR